MKLAVWDISSLPEHRKYEIMYLENAEAAIIVEDKERGLMP